MWSKKFLKTISESLAESQTTVYLIKKLEDSSRLKALSSLNPDKIYLENISSVFGVSYAIAKLLCETAVRRGVFSRSIEVLCPDDTVAVTVTSEDDLPLFVLCTTFQDGDYDENEYAASCGVRFEADFLK